MLLRGVAKDVIAADGQGDGRGLSRKRGVGVFGDLRVNARAARATFPTIYMPDTARESLRCILRDHGLWKSEHELDAGTPLRSKPMQMGQPPHTDFPDTEKTFRRALEAMGSPDVMAVHAERIAETFKFFQAGGYAASNWPLPYSVIVGRYRQRLLVVDGKAIAVDPGDVLCFRGDVPHCGTGMYQEESWCWFFYVDSSRFYRPPDTTTKLRMPLADLAQYKIAELHAREGKHFPFKSLGDIRQAYRRKQQHDFVFNAGACLGKLGWPRQRRLPTIEVEAIKTQSAKPHMKKQLGDADRCFLFEVSTNHFAYARIKRGQRGRLTFHPIDVERKGACAILAAVAAIQDAWDADDFDGDDDDVDADDADDVHSVGEGSFDDDVLDAIVGKPLSPIDMLGAANCEIEADAQPFVGTAADCEDVLSDLEKQNLEKSLLGGLETQLKRVVDAPLPVRELSNDLKAAAAAPIAVCAATNGAQNGADGVYLFNRGLPSACWRYRAALSTDAVVRAGDTDAENAPVHCYTWERSHANAVGVLGNHNAELKTLTPVEADAPVIVYDPLCDLNPFGEEFGKLPTGNVYFVHVDAASSTPLVWGQAGKVYVDASFYNQMHAQGAFPGLAMSAYILFTGPEQTIRKSVLDAARQRAPDQWNAFKPMFDQFAVQVGGNIAIPVSRPPDNSLFRCRRASRGHRFRFLPEGFLDVEVNPLVNTAAEWFADAPGAGRMAVELVLEQPSDPYGRSHVAMTDGKKRRVVNPNWWPDVHIDDAIVRLLAQRGAPSTAIAIKCWDGDSKVWAVKAPGASTVETAAEMPGGAKEIKQRRFLPMPTRLPIVGGVDRFYCSCSLRTVECLMRRHVLSLDSVARGPSDSKLSVLVEFFGKDDGTRSLSIAVDVPMTSLVDSDGIGKCVRYKASVDVELLMEVGVNGGKVLRTQAEHKMHVDTFEAHYRELTAHMEKLLALGFPPDHSQVKTIRETPLQELLDISKNAKLRRYRAGDWIDGIPAAPSEWATARFSFNVANEPDMGLPPAYNGKEVTGIKMSPILQLTATAGQIRQLWAPVERPAPVVVPRTSGTTIAGLHCVCEAGELILTKGKGKLYAVDPANTRNPTAKVLLWAEQHTVVAAAAVDSTRSATAIVGQALEIPCGETWIITCVGKVSAKAFAADPGVVSGRFGLSETVGVLQPRKRRKRSTHS
ncbi:MAG: hypothetical protein CL678_04075 [Bdellovibrionaceae bacterium]|nr:hypothetical protein [Pseudobdellovibrionaceae bacterium]